MMEENYPPSPSLSLVLSNAEFEPSLQSVYDEDAVMDSPADGAVCLRTQWLSERLSLLQPNPSQRPRIWHIGETHGGKNLINTINVN